MSVYRVHFTWNKKNIQLSAKSLDLTHPYFVSIKDLIFPQETKIIIDPAEDEIRKTFGKASHLMIPFQKVSLIEEYKDSQADTIRPFAIVDEQENDTSGDKKHDD